MITEFILRILVFCLGAAIGSFLNVCIYRLPKKESIVRPASHCVHCRRPLAWFDNIPLLSIIFLKGRCRYCGQRISRCYFIVEAISGCVFLILFIHFGLAVKFWVYAALTAALIVASFIDIAIREIPDEISLSGIVLGLLVCLIFPQLQGEGLSRLAALGWSFVGLLAGGGSIFVTGLIGDAIFKKESMGGGDVKLMAMVGAFLGWQLAVMTFFIAPVFGSVVGIVLKIKKGESFIPYGPFLSLAALISILWGEQIIKWLFVI